MLKQAAKSIVLGIAKRSCLARSVAQFITDSVRGDGKDTYAYLKERFIQNGNDSKFDRGVRARLVERFEAVDREVPTGTTATDGLILAEALLSTQAPGAIVECGCYAGASSAKLSVVAGLLGEQLVVFDSFEGLPTVDKYNLTDRHCRRGSDWVTNWTAGRYAARLDKVRSNVERHGDISVCSFVPGWFNETLSEENLPSVVRFAFTDVDIASSARECLVAIWPRLSDRGVYVSHDAAYIKVLQALHDEELWANLFKSFPPILFGAGFGVYDASPHIGYFVKGRDLSPEYLKSLTLDK